MKKPDFTEVNEDFFEVLRRWIREKYEVKMRKLLLARSLKAMNVFSWPIWTKEVSTFDWHYDEKEACYLLEGEVTVKTPHETVSFGN